MLSYVLKNQLYIFENPTHFPVFSSIYKETSVQSNDITFRKSYEMFVQLINDIFLGENAFFC